MKPGDRVAEGSVGQRGAPVAVPASGGVDTVALTVELARRHERVHPIFVRSGLRCEETELEGLRAFLEAVAHPRIGPITVLNEPVAEVYGLDHWSLGGIVGPCNKCSERRRAFDGAGIADPTDYATSHSPL